MRTMWLDIAFLVESSSAMTQNGLLEVGVFEVHIRTYDHPQREIAILFEALPSWPLKNAWERRSQQSNYP
jgi:hypothetical protein